MFMRALGAMTVASKKVSCLRLGACPGCHVMRPNVHEFGAAEMLSANLAPRLRSILQLHFFSVPLDIASSNLMRK